MIRIKRCQQALLKKISRVGLTMAVKIANDSSSNKGHSESDNIRQRLASKFLYYNERVQKWYRVTNLIDPECQSESIVLRCKYAPQILRLPSPFKVPTGLAYLWGLIAGSTCRKNVLEFTVDANIILNSWNWLTTIVRPLPSLPQFATRFD